MKIFIWERLRQISHRYHSEGGVLAVAESVEEARKQIYEYINGPEGAEPWETFYGTIKGVPEGEEPDYILNTDSTEPLVCVFPDAGCC